MAIRYIYREEKEMRHFLKDILKEQHLTHEVAASRCQVSRAYLTQIINGERRPSPQVAKRIAVALGFPDTWYRLLEDNNQEEECEKHA